MIDCTSSKTTAAQSVREFFLGISSGLKFKMKIRISFQTINYITSRITSLITVYIWLRMYASVCKFNVLFFVGLYLKLGYDILLPHPFLFNIILYWTLYSLSYRKKVVKQTTNSYIFAPLISILKPHDVSCVPYIKIKEPKSIFWNQVQRSLC